MKIETKGNCEYLVINVLGSSNVALNPFSVNLKHVTYIREYEVADGENCWAVFVGDKMLSTKDLNAILEKIPEGEFASIGKTMFECVIAAAISDKRTCRYFINHDMILFGRKFLPKKSTEDDDNKKTKAEESTEKSDRFIIYTIDQRYFRISKCQSRCINTG